MGSQIYATIFNYSICYAGCICQTKTPTQLPRLHTMSTWEQAPSRYMRGIFGRSTIFHFLVRETQA